MIIVRVKNKDNFIESFTVSGHADYDEYGKDIVCASVSSITISSINLAIRIDKSSVNVVNRDGLLDVKVLKQDEIINKIFINMVEMLKELEGSYSKNIKIYR